MVSSDKVTIRSSGNKHSSPKIIGFRVSQVRDEFRRSLDIADDSVATVASADGNSSVRVEESYILRGGDTITFSRPTGTKG